MKQALKIIFAGTLLFTCATAPLRAQTKAPVESASNAAIALADAAADAPTTNSFANAIENSVGHVDVVALAAIAIAFLIPVCVLGIRSYAIVRDHQNLYRESNQTLRAMIEKGVPLTPELMESIRGKQFPPVPKPRRAQVGPGLFLAVIGAILVGWGHSTGGWIVIFIGIAFISVAFLIAWLIESRKSNDQSSQNPVPASQPPKQ